MAEHFVQPPHWEWYILAYFFLAGLAGGSYALGALLRISGNPDDEAVARVAFRLAFPLLILCPILLTLDLGQPLRFWHMLLNTTPGQSGPIFRSWSPMSVGSWVLLVFGFFTFVSYIEARTLDRRIRGALGEAVVRALSGGFGLVFTAVGAFLGLFVASYTGVLLSVSNQPIWSDTWTLGGLFLASGLSGSAALLSVAPRRPDATGTEARVRRADGYFAVLELVLIVLFFLTLGTAGTLPRVLAAPWLVLWLVVAIGLVPPLLGLAGREAGPGARIGAGTRAPGSGAAVAVLVLVGVLALRAVVIFSAQV
jgi:formate-dependent nitrite reductase membrane component NrfD